MKRNKMAEFNTKVTQTLLLIICITGTQGFSLTDGFCSYKKTEKSGDVKYLVVAGKHESGANGRCSNVESRSTGENLAVLDWILDIVNSDKANNLTIGYDLYDNCDNEDLTTDLLYSGDMAGQTMTCDKTPDNSPVYIGVISLTTPDATKLISRYTQPLPVLRPLMSSPMLHSSDYPNLLQTVVAFKQEAMAITKMLTTIGWNYVVLIYSEATQEEAEVFDEMAHAQGICFKYKGLPTNKSIAEIHNALNNAYNKSIAVIYFGNPSSVINFINREKSLTRPYLSNINWILSSHIALNNRVVTRPDDTITYVQYQNHLISAFDQSLSVINPYHMTDAIMVSASAAKQVWDSVCTDLSVIDGCPGFTNAVKDGNLLATIKQGVKIRDFYNRTIQFEDDGTQQYSTLDLRFKNSQQMDKIIGSYTIDGTFTLSENAPTVPTSAAGLGQHECLEQIDLRYSYLHGDVLLLGLFTVRNAGNSAFKCGLIRRGVNDIITVSSFFQSVLSRRRKTDSYKLGAIAIDDCYNGINTNEYLTALFSKKRFILDPLTNKVINFDDVIVVIGALSSPVTLLVADLATSIHIPMLSYSASSPELDNKNRYPYFLRSVPSDSLQVQGMIQILVKLNISHVGLIYIDDAYGKGGKMRLEEEASSFNICVEPPIRVTQNMTNEHVSSHVVDELKKQQVRVVLFFGIDTIAKKILDAMDSSDVPFVFIASEAWGTNRKLIAGPAGQRSKGSIVFNIDTKSNENDSYKDYLQSLNDKTVDPNRWIPNYFDDYNGCYSIDSFEKTKTPVPIICGGTYNSTLNANTTKYLNNDQRAVHTMNSVFAATESIRRVCGDCSSANIKSRIDSYFEKMKNTHFQTTQTPMFDADGNGNIGYTIYNIQMKTIFENGKQMFTSVYEPIGHYTKNGKLDIDLTKLIFYDERHNEMTLEELGKIDKVHCSTYQQLETCSKVCPRSTTTKPTTAAPTEATTTQPNSDSSWKTVAIAFIFGFGIVVFALCVVIIRPCVMKQVSSDKDNSSGRTRSVSGSHSVYDEPGCLRRREFDNLMFMPDSASLRSQPHILHNMSGSGVSSNNYSPTQYTQIRQMSNPELRFHHVRQTSNHELKSHTFDTLERPMSTISAPAYKPHTVHNQAAKRIQHNIEKYNVGKQTYSPRTPHSAPSGEKKRPVVYKPRTLSSPRFRYPSSDESHYTLPKIHSNDETLSKRKYGISDEDIHGHHDISDESADHEPYLEFGNDHQDEEEPTLNYISAKDLVTDKSDEEEDAIEDDGETVQYADTNYVQAAPPSGTNPLCPPSGLALNDRQTGRLPTTSSSITSPSDHEVMNINFPPSDSEQSPNSLKQTKAPTSPNSGEVTVRQSIDNNRNNSITDVPDVIKHGLYEEDGVFII